MAGLWFEQFEVQQVFDHEIRRTVLESDNMWFSNATCNPAAIHIDAEYCKGTEFGRPLMNSVFSLGLVIGLSVQDTTLGTTVANLGMTDVRFPNPVFAGDTLAFAHHGAGRCAQASRVLTPASSRFCTRASTRTDQEVVTCTRQALMLRKSEVAA